MQEEIHRLLQKGVVEESFHEPGEFISPVFLRAKDDNSFRMILNLKRLNEVAQYNHFKMETLSSILTLVRPGCFMAKIDIKDAYYSVPIRKVDQKLLKFVSNGKLLKFTVLPNGYTGGPRKFTKLMKPPLATLRMDGATLAAYIDDIFNSEKSYQACCLEC